MNDDINNRNDQSGNPKQHGHIPFWLKVVAVILVIWGVYYLIASWSPPPE
jgi:hypothetical protein